MNVYRQLLRWTLKEFHRIDPRQGTIGPEGDKLRRRWASRADRTLKQLQVKLSTIKPLPR